jgi:archaellum component FlaF (FlaF/FlaG flagellin family)
VVIGIAIAMSIEILTTNVLPAIDNINTAYHDLQQRIDTQTHANINITTITRTPNSTNYDYTITIHNTGTITLPTTTMTLLINGTQQPFTTTTTYLYPDTTTTLTAPNIPGDTEQRIKIITENAISDYHTYIP